MNVSRSRVRDADEAARPWGTEDVGSSCALRAIISFHALRAIISVYASTPVNERREREGPGSVPSGLPFEKLSREDFERLTVAVPVLHPRPAWRPQVKQVSGRRTTRGGMGVVHPLVIRVLCLAAGVGAIAVEFLQGIPELLPGTHAVGEVIRNLGYAFATAYIFYYFLEERPQQRRRRDAYANSERVLTRLVGAGPRLLESLATNAELQIERDAMTPGEAWTVIG